MQDRNPRDRRAPYTGRFASPGEAVPPRASARPEADGAYTRSATARDASRSAGAQPQRRPSGFAVPEDERRRFSAAEAPKEDGAPEKKPGRFKLFARRSREEGGGKSPTKRSQVKKLGWKKKLLIALVMLLALFLLLVLIFGRDDGTYHQLPRIERGGDSAYEPDQSPSPEGSDTGAAGETEYLVNPGAAGAGSGEVDWSQYLVTPEPGQDLSAAAAAAGASLDAAAGEAEE